MSEYQLATTLTCGFAVIFVALARRLNGTHFSPIPLFWGAWSFLFLSGALVLGERSLPMPKDSTFFYFWRMTAGAVVGSLLGLLLSRRARRVDSQNWSGLYSQAEQIFRTAYPGYVIGMLAFGSLHFVQRWQAVDFDFARLYELRVLALSEAWTPAARVAAIISQFGFFLAIVRGLLDAAKAEFSVRTVLVLSLASAPHGLAFGGRGWTLAVTMAYMASYFLARSAPGIKRATASYLAPRIIVLVGSGLVVFTMLGQIRDPDYNEFRDDVAPANWDARTNSMFLRWMASSLVAIGPHAEFTEQLSPAWGETTFEYVSLKLDALGLAQYQTNTWNRWLRYELRNTPRVGFTWCVPPTFIPYLVLDYGITGLPIATAILLILLQWVCIRSAGTNIFRHTIALLAILCALSTVQTLAVFSSQHVVIGVAAFAVEMILRWLRTTNTSLGERPALPRVTRNRLNGQSVQ